MVTRGYPIDELPALGCRGDQGPRRQWASARGIYYFGDRDPTGRDIDRAIVARHRRVHALCRSDPTQVAWKLAAELFGFGDIVDDVEAFDEFATFSRVAVTAEQIERWSLPPRPTKRTDSRSRKFDGESVELDAIPSSTLRELATNAIEQHVDQHQLKVLQTVEQEERRLLLQMAESFNGGGET